MKLGFPRAVNYYDYYPFWAVFFHRLGIELVTTPPTNRRIMELGLKAATDDTCLPIKILAGHLKCLKDVDAVFLPRLVSVEEKTYMCPKILGIPESVLRAVPPNLPVITVALNRREGKRQVVKALEGLGDQLGKGKAEIRGALREAEDWQRYYEHQRKAGYDFQESVNLLQSMIKGSAPKDNAHPPEREEERREAGRPTIALVGHAYLINESYANLDLLAKLRGKADVRLVENISLPEVEHHLKGLRKKMFWSHAKRILGAGHTFVADERVDGLIYLSCFGCGTDSMTQDLLARKARQEHKPYMVLTLDEHSGEAGLVTRLEAFLDMIERRKRHESDISSYGECLDCNPNAL